MTKLTEAQRREPTIRERADRLIKLQAEAWKRMRDEPPKLPSFGEYRRRRMPEPQEAERDTTE